MTHAFQHDTNEGGGVVGRSYPQAVGCGWLRAWGGRGWRRRLLRPPGAYSGTNVGTNVSTNIGTNISTNVGTNVSTHFRLEKQTTKVSFFYLGTPVYRSSYISLPFVLQSHSTTFATLS